MTLDELHLELSDKIVDVAVETTSVFARLSSCIVCRVADGIRFEPEGKDLLQSHRGAVEINSDTIVSIDDITGMDKDMPEDMPYYQIITEDDISIYVAVSDLQFLCI